MMTNHRKFQAMYREVSFAISVTSYGQNMALYDTTDLYKAPHHTGVFMPIRCFQLALYHINKITSPFWYSVVPL